MPDAVGYVRVSTEKQKEEDSHVRQEAKLREWADQNGYDIDIFKDIAVSGQYSQRSGYQEMMENIDDYDILVVRELSRFGRDPIAVMQDIEALDEKHDVEFKSLSEDFDTSSAMGKAMLRMVAVFNGMYADLRREQAEEMIQRRREEGKPIGRPRKLSQDQIEQVKDWKERDLSYAQIAALCKERWDIDLHQSTIARYCNEVVIE